MVILHKHLSDQGTFAPVGAQGRGNSMEPPKKKKKKKKKTFPPEFCNGIGTIYVRTVNIIFLDVFFFF